MIAAARPLQTLLRRTRRGIMLAGIALDRRRELGFAGLAAMAVSRISTRSRPRLPTDAPEPAPGAAFDVIYAIGYWDGEPKRYRVFNPAEGLRAAGYSVHVMPFDRIADIPRLRWTATALVLFRAEFHRLAGIEETLAYARRGGMRVVYDIDDLVFDPDIADRIDGLQQMGPHQRRQSVAAMARRRRLLLASDLVTASTAPLARAAAALGRPSAVIPNSLNAAQLDLAATIAAAPPPARDFVRIGYFSGTRTHQRDFRECEAALLEILARHRQVRFRVVGHLDLGPQWHRFGDRIERIGMIAPDTLMCSVAETDINLAPLEPGNPFCEAKSELKFFEAAIVGVPTVASPTEPLATAIERGVTGFLARNPADWRSALDALVASEPLRRAVGEAARASAGAHYAPSAMTPRVVAALMLAPKQVPAAQAPAATAALPG